MKNFLLIAILALISCSKTSEQKMQANIKEYLIKHVNDPSSYQGVEYGKIDTVYDSFSLTKDYIDLDDSLQKLERIFNYNKSRERDLQTDLILDKDVPPLWKKEQHELDSLNKINEPMMVNQKVISDQIDSLKKAFKPKCIGYAINHSFRVKSVLGLVLNQYKFTLDTNLNVLAMTEPK